MVLPLCPHVRHRPLPVLPGAREHPQQLGTGHCLMERQHRVVRRDLADALEVQWLI